MNNTLNDLRKYFQHIDATPAGWPAYFEFCVPGRETAFSRWPDYPAAARVEAGRAAGGRGLGRQRCRDSGLGEAIELASLCQWKDESVERAPYEGVRETAVAPCRLAGLTESQREERHAWNEIYGGLDWRGRALTGDEPVDWMEARDPAGNKRLVPAESVLIGRSNRGDSNAFMIADTCGCAAGPEAVAAKLGAILELVERDAVGRWWYGARLRAQFGLDIVAREERLLEFLERRERVTTLFDITTDIEVPVIAAVSWNDDGGTVAMGFSARFSHQAAAAHALVEMLQGEIALDQRKEVGDGLLPEWLEKATADLPALSPPRVAARALTLPGEGAEACLQVCLDRLERLGLEVYFIDRTRPQFGIPVFRAVAPDLCRDKPRWNYDRLCAADERDLGPKPVPDDDGHPPNQLPLMV